MKIGSLFAGYGGLDMGVSSVLGGDLAWYAEFDKHPAAIMAHHHPDVPNLWDVSKVDWTAVEPVDVLTGGSPCQDLSHAGKRAGMTEGTRSNLWVAMREAIAVLRPSLVVWENVRGAYSAPADSAVEHCAGCMGDGDGRPVLRALGRVLGDLADLRYDTRWYGLRAADVGAPHGRFRVFLFATPADADVSGLGGLGRLVACARDADGRDRADGPRAATEPATRDGLTLLPTPVSDNSRGLPSSSTDYASLANVAATLLPAPRATDGTKGGPNQRGSSGDLMLPSAVQLLSTPQSRDYKGVPSDGYNTACLVRDVERSTPQEWGDYAPAIARWETVIGRPAPAPTEPGPKGNPRLSPIFVEFLMGLPEGHVTDPAIGLTRNAQLKCLGNGVVWQQCAAATQWWLAQIERTAA